MGTKPTGATDPQPSTSEGRSITGFKPEEVHVGEKQFLEDTQPLMEPDTPTT